MIYFRQSGQYEQLTINAPSLYQWIPNRYHNWYPLGIAFTILVVLIVAYFVYKNRVDITSDLLIYLATFSTLIMPFFLPRMHDRYFFPASVIAIVLAFRLPKYWYVAMIIGLVQTLTSLSFLYAVAPVPLPLLAVFLLVLIAVLGWKLLLTLDHAGESYLDS